MDLSEIMATSIVLLLIMDPFGNMPVFHTILSHLEPRRRFLIIVRELLIALCILVIFLVSGNAILGFLGITQPSLSIAGGVLLFIISLKMIFSSHSPYSTTNEEPMIVPLAMPIIAGPSTISVLLILSSSQPEKIVQWGIALGIAWSVSTIILSASPFLMERIGNRGAVAMARLMGMILVILATQMLLDGIGNFVASL